jgi:uncharacterized protein with ParB-like and HNH nuclease domain
MVYQAKSIKQIVNEINAKVFLPHIQRELVWQPPQISKLFDSLMRGYPINTFLFWRIAEKKNITKLEFIKNYEKGKKNELHSNTDKEEYWLVLDGQQRLQSFYIALQGSYGGKELFLNALSEKPNDEDNDDEENEIIYETKFFKHLSDHFFKDTSDKTDGKKLWVKVKSFALLEQDKLDDFIDQLKNELEDQLSVAQGRLFERNLKKLHTLVSSAETIFFYLEQEEDYDKVLDIFIRTNSGGTKLSKSDLLFSMIKLQWKNRNAYELFNQLENDLNGKGEFEFDKDFILKTALVLIGADPRYRLENFNRENIFAIEEHWDKIETSIRVTIDLLIGMGITTKKILASKNSLIPIIYYTYRSKIKAYSSNDKLISETAKDIRRWLLRVLLVNLYSSQTDEMLKRARDVIENNQSKLFPADAIIKNLPPGKSAELREENFYDISYGDGRALLVLSILYPDFNLNPVSDSNKPNVDHIFPHSLSDKGLDLEMLNNIGNLELLADNENKSKNDMSFEKWLQSRHESFLQKNYIPTDDTSLFSENKYREFIKCRREIMFNAIINSHLQN